MCPSVHLYVCPRVCVHARVHVHMCVCMCVHACAHVCAFVCACTCACVCVCVHLCVSVRARVCARARVCVCDLSIKTTKMTAVYILPLYVVSGWLPNSKDHAIQFPKSLSDYLTYNTILQIFVSERERGKEDSIIKTKINVFFPKIKVL